MADDPDDDALWDDEDTLDLPSMVRADGGPRTWSVQLSPDDEAVFESLVDEWSLTMTAEGMNTVSLKRTVQTSIAIPGSCDAPPRRTVSETGAEQSDADYALLETIGKGGMGEVHLARQRGLGREVALKRLRRDKRHQPATRNNFVVEAVVTGQLDHPNIVALHELSVDAEGQPFYTMRRVRGEPWSKVYQDRGLHENLEIFLRVCDAMAFAHSRGVLHRDLKPGNVMLGDYGEVLVMDWGLAVAVPGFPHSPAPSLAGHSRREAVGGTPAYMPPEMALGQSDAIGVHSDVYLMGAVLFELLNGEPPHDGRSVVDCLRNAAANRIVDGRRRRGELARIARQAMATDPAERFEHIWALQSAVRDYLNHAESMDLADRSGTRLEQAVETGDYHLFARALYGFDESLELWPGNKRAQQGVGEARWAYAAAALEKNDLDLAQRLIEDDPDGLEDLAGQLHQAREERDRKEKAEHRLQRVEAVRRMETNRDWQVLCDEDFQNEGFRERWDVISPGVMWHPGELRIWGGSPSLMIFKGEAPGDVRLSFEARLEGDSLNDISCFLSASPAADKPDQLRKLGYEFKYGGYDNTRTCLYRAGTLVIDRQEEPLEYGRTYAVTAERIGARIRMFVDGVEVIDFEDAEVLAGGAQHVVGIIGWHADYCISRIRIERLGAPLKADLLAVAADHLSRGHINTAVDLYDDVLSAAVDADRRRQAQDGLKRALQLRSLSTRMPLYRKRVLEAWPDARVRVADDGLRVDVRGLGIDDLEPLRGMPVKQLDCSGNRIENLDPLSGMPLVELRCGRNRIKSLEPLRGLPLGLLHCSHNRIKSVSPLAEMPLEELEFVSNRISDLAPLRRLSLVRLDCSRNMVTTLAPLAQMPLRSLSCDGNRITSLTPLAGIRLQALQCRGNDIDGLTGLEGTRLHSLDCADNRIHTLAPLCASELEWCFVDGNPLVDFGPLAERPPLGFSFACPDLPATVLQAAAEHWETIDRKVLADQAQVMLARRQGDLRALQRLARPVGTQQVLLINERCTWDEAKRRCEELGGRLCCPALGDEDRALHPFLPPGTVAWIGLHGRDDERWLDGRPVEHHRFHWHCANPAGVLWSATGWRIAEVGHAGEHGFIVSWPLS